MKKFSKPSTVWVYTNFIVPKHTDTHDRAQNHIILYMYIKLHLDTLFAVFFYECKMKVVNKLRRRNFKAFFVTNVTT